MEDNGIDQGTFSACVRVLQDLGLHLPADTTADNLVERICVAGHALHRWPADDDEPRGRTRRPRGAPRPGEEPPPPLTMGTLAAGRRRRRRGAGYTRAELEARAAAASPRPAPGGERR